MDIGRLNRMVEILQFFKGRDEYGGETGIWKPVAKVWAAITPISGTEQMFAQQVTAEKVVRITIRFCDWLTVLHRIRYGEKLYEIVGELDSETAHRATIINAKELVSDGLQRKTKESQSNRGGCEFPCERPQGDGRCGGSSHDGGGKGRR